MVMQEKIHSGFEAPAIGTVYPKESTIKRNKDGTITVIPPRSVKKPSKKKEIITDVRGSDRDAGKGEHI